MKLFLAYSWQKKLKCFSVRAFAWLKMAPYLPIKWPWLLSFTEKFLVGKTTPDNCGFNNPQTIKFAEISMY